MKRRIITITLALLIAVTMLAGCTNSGTPAASSAASTSAPAATSAAAAATAAATAASAPEPAERKTLTLMFNEQPTLEDVNTNYATGYLEERYNVDLVFELLPNTQWQDKFEVMVAANEKLPDILMGSSNSTFVSKHAANGTFIDYTPYYEQYSVHMKAAFDNDPYAKSQLVFPDGKMYSVGRVQYQTHTEYSPKLYINETWLNNLGLPVPQTYEELINTYRAFRDNDPNGNGQKDEIPMTGQKDETGFGYLMGAFTFVNGAHNLQAENGKLNLCYTTDGWRNGLRSFSELWKEGGIFDPLVFTQDLEAERAICQKDGDLIVGAVTAMNSTMPFQNSANAFEYVGAGPFKGPDGTQYSAYSPPSVSYNGQITKDCADPAFAFQFLDNTWELETTMVIRYGEQGVDWDWLPEGTHGRYTDGLGVPAAFSLMTTVQTGVQNKWWNVWSPLYIPYKIGDGWPDLDPTDTAKAATDVLGQLVGYLPDEVVGRLLFTPEETTEINEILTNLNRYRSEAMALFIMGEMDIETEWDAYLAEIESIGAQKYLEVAQRAYDRMK